MSRAHKKFFIILFSIVFINHCLFITSPSKSSDSLSTILHEIASIPHKYLVTSQQIGEQHVSYWYHNFENITIKNDYILLHTDPMQTRVHHYEKQWTPEAKLRPSIPPYLTQTPLFHPNEVIWQQLCIFQEPHDITPFYTILQYHSFPLLCWEVRHLDGSTQLYDTQGQSIGYGIPTPFSGFSLSGFHEPSWPDPWLDFRLNADHWFQKWSTQTYSISTPSPQVISSYVGNADYSLFYELAHGSETYFQADAAGSYYTSSMVNTDLQNREKYLFAFIGSCHGMTTTGPGTFSHEFRKGEMIDTVTIGYDHMETCPGWSYALQWQDYMFYAMDAGFTIKAAFDMATAEYPTIAPAVVFVGDETLKIKQDNNDDEEEDDAGIPPYIFISHPLDNSIISQNITITGTANDPDGYVDAIYIKIDDKPWKKAVGTDNWHYIWDTTLDSDGIHIITAVAIDNNGLQSGCFYRTVNVSNQNISILYDGPLNGFVGVPLLFSVTVIGGHSPYRYLWDLGDGSIGTEKQISHMYSIPGTYTVSITITDSINRTASDQHSVTVIVEDTTPPLIHIYKPERAIYIHNTKIFPFFAPIIIGDLTIHIEAFDEETTIEQITLYIDQRETSTVQSSSLFYEWREQNSGRYTLSIIATNDQKLTTTKTYEVYNMK